MGKRPAGWSNESTYGSGWPPLRESILKRDLYMCQCATCRALGRVRAATEVDHIVPKAKGGTDDPTNLQAINKHCHKRKTLLDRGARPARRIGIDGWPQE